MFCIAWSTVICPLATALIAVFTALENCGYQVGVPCANSGSTVFDCATRASPEISLPALLSSSSAEVRVGSTPLA